MNNILHDAFEPIHSTEKMKLNLQAFVRGELNKRRRKAHAPLKYVLACCAAVLVAVCGFGGYSLYSVPVSYISVDVNPSVELALNRLDRVVSATAYNDDGALVLENLKLKNRTYTQAVELLLSDKTFESYLQKDSLLSFTVVSDNEDALLAGIQQCNGYPEAYAQCHSASAELMEEAHHNGLSMGKYQAFLELSQYDKAITENDCHSLSMRELRDRIDEYSGDAQAPNSEGHHGGGQGNMKGGGDGNGHHGRKGNKN